MQIGCGLPPWKWCGWNYGGDEFWTRDGLEGVLIDSNGDYVLHATTTEGEDQRIEAMSAEVARLIQSAPELLDALKTTQAIMRDLGWAVSTAAKKREAYAVVIAAIAKAVQS